MYTTLHNRRSQEFVLEGALLGEGTPNPWMAIVSLPIRVLSRKIKKFVAFFIKNVFLDHVRRGYSPI